jgi:2-oxoglutarate dehydrogenase E2 component (dihydrolipoamide succinyltransferase)
MDVIMPQLGETVAEGTVAKWYKKVGDAVKADETLFDVETDKVSTEIPSPVTGVVSEILVGEGASAKVGVRLAVIREEGGAAKAVVPAPRASAQAAAMPTPAAPAKSSMPRADATERLSPVVRRLVAEHALDVTTIAGGGRDGRITREDVVLHLEKRTTGRPETRAQNTPAYQYQAGGATRLPLNNIRKRTAEHTARVWNTVPHVLQAIEADFLRVEQARTKHGAAWKTREGFTLTYLPFIARAVSIALAKFPHLNASLDGDHLMLHKRINMGIAVDLGFDGLVVPVVKDVPNKSLPQIAREINDLALRARAGKLKPDDTTEGTYTLSNSGVFGTLITAPIVNAPQVAILSTDGVKKRAVVIESAAGDSIAIRPVGVLAQTFDHRAIDGAYSAAFLKEVKANLETRDWSQALEA